MDSGSDDGDRETRSLLYLKSAFLAMEPATCLISLARQSGGGAITAKVQTFILEDCLSNMEGRGTLLDHRYIKNILQKVIVAAESTCDVVEELYEKLSYYLTVKLEDDSLKEKDKIYKHISFLTSLGHNPLSSMDFIISLQCSLNMLEGDTGCALWPSSLFLSEFILSYAEIFANKCCFEVGSGVGLVGVTLMHVGASKVILTDGDMSSLANMKLNLELNQSNPGISSSQRCSRSPNLVECKYLPWESACELELQDHQPEIVLGADVIYDPLCIPHLVKVLSILLNPKKSSSYWNEGNGRSDFPKNQRKEAPVAYITTVIRNLDTFDLFLRLAAESHLSVLDITEMMKPSNLLPYMLSYDRQSVCLFRLSSSYN